MSTGKAALFRVEGRSFKLGSFSIAVVARSIERAIEAKPPDGRIVSVTKLEEIDVVALDDAKPAQAHVGVQLTQEPSPRIAELNRAAATVAGHPDPVSLLEKLTKPDEPVRIVVGSIVVEEVPCGIRIDTVQRHARQDIVERADIEDLHKALGQYLARKSFEKAKPAPSDLPCPAWDEHPDPRAEQAVTPFGGWAFVDREDGVLVARSPNGTDVPIMWPAPEGASQSFADAVHVHHPRRCSAWTKPGWLGWSVGVQPEDGTRCVYANGHEGEHRGLFRTAEVTLSPDPLRPGVVNVESASAEPAEDTASADAGDAFQDPWRRSDGVRPAAAKVRRDRVALKLLDLVDKAAQQNNPHLTRQWVEAYRMLVTAEVK